MKTQASEQTYFERNPFTVILSLKSITHTAEIFALFKYLLTMCNKIDAFN